MADYPLLKHYLDRRLVEQLAARVKVIHPPFDDGRFIDAASGGLNGLEMKQRFAWIADRLHEHLPRDYPSALRIMVAVIDESEGRFAPIDRADFRLLVIPTWLERHGLDYPRESLEAMSVITRYASCEGAIRPFIVQRPEMTMKRLRQWARDKNEHVRRLASEGSRPRLPWFPPLRQFIEDPSPTLSLLEALKDDPSLYVRRSVANHLNDISKDHPQLVMERMAAWSGGASKERMWLISHALRTLVKRGDQRALAILGYGEPQVDLSELKLSPRRLNFGGALTFAFRLTHIGGGTQRLMIDYLLHFLKANGKTAPKVFKLKRATMEAGDSLVIAKTHAIRAISTRRYYAGRQRLEIQVNGRVIAGDDFTLVMNDN